MDRDRRENLMGEIYSAIAQAHDPGLDLFAVAFHKPSFPNQDPVGSCFEELCNRFDSFLQRLYREGEPQRGLMIFDRAGYANQLEQLRHQFFTVGTRVRRLVNLPEIPLFTDSHLSRMLQIADFCSYAVFRRYEAGDIRYFDMIANRFDQSEGIIHGLIHRISVQPRAPCMCPACLSRRRTS